MCHSTTGGLINSLGTAGGNNVVLDPPHHALMQVELAVKCGSMSTPSSWSTKVCVCGGMRSIVLLYMCTRYPRITKEHRYK